MVLAQTIEGSDQAGADDDAEEQPEESAPPDLESVRSIRRVADMKQREGNAYLAHKLIIGCLIPIRSKGLFQEGQKDRDNDASLESFAETDEEY